MPRRSGTSPIATPRRCASVWRLVALCLGSILVVAACGSEPTDATGASPSSVAATATPAASMDPLASIDPGVALCAHVATLAERMAGLQAVELRLANRVALDIELGKMQAAYSDLRQADLADLEERLEDPLTHLGYRIGELELAVEDFRTNPRPKRAAPHVEGDAAMVADAIASFGILARC